MRWLMRVNWQAGVNEYRPGAGIGWHKDKALFGIVVGVSLLAPATMRFVELRVVVGREWPRQSHLVRCMYCRKRLERNGSIYFDRLTSCVFDYVSHSCRRCFAG